MEISKNYSYSPEATSLRETKPKKREREEWGREQEQTRMTKEKDIYRRNLRNGQREERKKGKRTEE